MSQPSPAAENLNGKSSNLPFSEGDRVMVVEGKFSGAIGTVERIEDHGGVLGALVRSAKHDTLKFFPAEALRVHPESFFDRSDAPTSGIEDPTLPLEFPPANDRISDPTPPPAPDRISPPTTDRISAPTGLTEELEALRDRLRSEGALTRGWLDEFTKGERQYCRYRYREGGRLREEYLGPEAADLCRERLRRGKLLAHVAALLKLLASGEDK